jgi:protein-S-isoprenylcysteine O-methyltransferase Ste14
MKRGVKAASIGIYLTALLATLFFTYVTLQIPGFLSSINDGVFYDICRHFKRVGLRLDSVVILGDVILILVLAMAIMGIIWRRYYASFPSAVVYFAPTLFVFVVGMSTLFTGLEILYFPITYVFREYEIFSRNLWKFFYVGQVFLAPYWVAITAFASEGGRIWANIKQVRDVYGSTFIVVGLLVLFLGVAAWLNTKYQGRRLVDSGIYRLTRHPQYLGYILWSYGMLVLSTYNQAPWRQPVEMTLNWFVSSLILVGLALAEEINLRIDDGLNYGDYAERASFMFPLPRLVRKVFLTPFRIIWGSDHPENLRAVFKTLVLIFLVVSLPELILGGTYQFWNPHT